MESRNYTYRKSYRSGGYQFWGIYDRMDEEIAVTESEEHAELIVAALNGVAP